MNPQFCALLIGGDLANMFSNTGLVAKLVLAVLLVFSVFSWTIIASKWNYFKKARRQSAGFSAAFRRSARFQEVASAADNFKPSPLVVVYQGAIEEIRRGAGNSRLSNVQRAAQVASSEELTRMEQSLPWLATIASASPFVGLFGTVWGIIDAFQGLGTAGAATLRAVAPGISESLITTAAGLFAAIPALVAYNIFSNQIKQFGARMDDFILELLNAIEREIEVSQQGRR